MMDPKIAKLAIPTFLVAITSVLLVLLVQNEGGKLRQALRKSGREMAAEVISTAGNVAERTVHKTGQEVVKVAAEGTERTPEKAKEAIEAAVGSVSKPPSPSNGIPGTISDERGPSPTARDVAPGNLIPSTQERTLPSTKLDTPAASPITPTAKSLPQAVSPHNQNDSSTTRIPSPKGLEPPNKSGEVKQPAFDTQDPIGVFFKTGQTLAKSLDQVGQDFFRLDVEEEVRIGRDVRKHVLKETRVWQNPREQVRIERLAKTLLDQRTRTSIDYKFTLLDDSSVNAFSHLGGYVYFNRGLIQKGLSDAELQFVIGHEVAHVDLKHCVEKLTYAVRASGLAGGDTGNLVQLAYHGVALGYSEDQEFEADKWSYQGMRKIGRNKDECLAMTRRIADDDALEDANKSNSQNSTSAKVIKEVRDHFASHPPTTERLKRLAALP